MTAPEGGVPRPDAAGYVWSTVEEFFKAEIRVGRIVKVEPFPEARKPAYKMLVDFGDLGMKKSSAQITSLYTATDLVGTLVLAVTNFRPRQVGKFMSEVLILGVPVPGSDDVVLIRPDQDVAVGHRVL